MSDHYKFSRRDLLKAAAAGTLSLSSFPLFHSARKKKVPPSDRIHLGFVGLGIGGFLGGRGTHHLKTFLDFEDTQVVALCDVDERALRGAQKITEDVQGSGSATWYRHFEDLLQHRDLDAVVIATPDHWHSLITIAAMRAGKDVYVEKPMAHSIREGRLVCDVARATGRIVQTGSQERSTPTVRLACEHVRNGRLGKLRSVQVQLPCKDPHHLYVKYLSDYPKPMPVPRELDWGRWLGPAREVPYTEKRAHFWWRYVMEYGGGEMADRGAHVLDLAQLGADKDATGPVSIEASGTRTKGSLYDAFWDFRFVNTYADGLQFIGTPEGARGLKFVGDDGWIFVHVHGGKLEASDPSLLVAEANPKIDLGRSPGHHRNFLDCVKSRRAPIAAPEAAHRTGTLCHLNNLAMELGRPLKWDPQAEAFVGDAEANALLAPKMRPPWQI